jgi:hypothetical protein
MHALQIHRENKINKKAKLVLILFIGLLGMMTYTYINMSGAYSKEVNLIMLFPKDSTVEWNLYAASHEIGHYVYYKKLSQEDRDLYERIYKDSNMRVSEYGATNVQENFAEEFAQAVSYTYDLSKVSEDRQNFFKTNVSNALDEDYYE